MSDGNSSDGHRPVRKLLRPLATLALGTLGGAIFFHFGLPLPWMLGAMVISTAAAVAGTRPQVPATLRMAMASVLGLMLGSTFTPEVLAKAAHWPLTIGALFVYIALLTAALYLYYTRVKKYDPVTAYFSAAPGGLSEMVLIGGASGGDERTIALLHAARVLLVVIALPFWFRYVDGSPAPVMAASADGATLFDVGVLLACAVAGVFLGKLLHLPAHWLVGPMLLSAAAHASGVIRAVQLPELVAAAQVVIGSSVGERFAGVPLRRVLDTLVASVGATALMLSISVLFAFGLSQFVAMDVRALVLAFAPGGLAEMSLVALSLGIDIAFVATHHGFRVIMIVIAAPLAFRMLRK